MPELVKKLIVPPGKRTEYDCKLMAKALYVFISSIPAFKDGLVLLLLFCFLLTQPDFDPVSPESLIFAHAM